MGERRGERELGGLTEREQERQGVRGGEEEKGREREGERE